MRSTHGFFAAIAFLITVPLALLSQILFGSGAEVVLHFVCGIGFALISLAVFDFKLPKWITWIGFVAASAAAIIFLLQGVSNLIPNDSLHYLAFSVLGQWPENLSINLLIFWFAAMLVFDSQGKTRIFGLVVMSIVISLEVYRYALAYLGGTAAEGLKLFYLLVFVWFLLESRKQVPVGEKVSKSLSGPVNSWLKRYPVLAGFVLMFVFTWPIDLWAAANSHGLVSLPIPPILPLLVGYGFVAASLIMTGIISGRPGIRALLRQFLVWRVGLPWYGVALFGFVVIDLAAIALHVLLGGAVPDFTQPFARQIVGPSINLWVALPIFFLMGVFTNGEEIGWRGYALPKLQARHGALIASLIIGVIWAFWHVPKFLTAGSAQDYSFWLFLLDTIAKAILFTWVYNNTKSSLLMVTLLHASLNTAYIFLPIQPTAIGDVRPALIAIGLDCLAAMIVVIVAGPARLSRSMKAPVRVSVEQVAES